MQRRRTPRPGGLVLLVLLAAAPASAQQSGPVAPPTPNGTAPQGVLPARPVPGLVLAEVHLRDLPNARTVWSLIETVDPFVVVDRIANGGLYLGEPEWFGSHGSSGTQSGFVMDGLDLTDPERTGTPLMQLDPEFLQAVGVSYSFLPPSFNGAGTTLVLVPRAGGARWSGGFRAAYLPHQLQADNARDGAPSIARFGTTGEGELLLGGPLGRRLGLFAAGRGATSRRFERDDPTALDSRLASGFFHATASLSNDDRLRVVASVDRASRPFFARARFPAGLSEVRDLSGHVHATYEHLTPEGTAFSASVGYQVMDAGSPGGEGPVTGVIERLRDGPVSELVAPAVGPRGRYGVVFQLHPGFGLERLGHLSAGLSLNHAFSKPAALQPALIGELIDGLPARVWDVDFGPGTGQRHATEIAAWANGRIPFHRRLGLDLGARLDWTEARSDGNNEDFIRWRTFLPRALLQWQVTEGGGIGAFIGYGWYRHRLPLGYTAYGDASAPAALVYRWNDRNGDRWVQPGERGQLVAAAGPGARSFFESRIDPDLEAPIAKQFVVGFDLRLAPRWRFRTTGFERRDNHLVSPVDEGVTLEDYRAFDIPDQGADYLNPADDRMLTVYDRLPSSFGQDRDVLTNPDGHDAHYIGVDVALERVFDGRWHMLFGAAAHRSDGIGGNRGFRVTENDIGVLGETFQDPNAFTYARGRLFFERGYIIKWSGGLLVNRGLHLGAVARYQDGQHFARLVVVPDLAQGPEAIQAYTRGHSRFTFTFTLDARAEQAFEVKGARLGVVVEAFNLLNTSNEVEEDPVTTPAFRATTAVQPPRAIRFGLRYDF